MTVYKILNTTFRTITAFILIGASITVPLSAAAAESAFMSAELQAAAMEASDRLKDEFSRELAETIRPPTTLRVNIEVATVRMEDIEHEDELMSFDATNESRANDT